MRLLPLLLSGAYRNFIPVSMLDAQNVEPGEDIQEDTWMAIDAFHNLSQDATLVNASNVATWVEGGGSKTVKSLKSLLDQGGSIPPWHHTWVEWEHLDTINGALILNWDLDEFRQDGGMFPDDESRWMLEIIQGFTLYPAEGIIHGPYHTFRQFIDKEGRPTREMDVRPLSWRLLVDSMGGIQSEVIATMHLGVIFFTFQFANCRNVDRIEVLPSRQQRRAAERKGEPVFKHYVLAIDANTQRKVYPKQAIEQLPANKRLHICRGHFATYTEAAPLFGKHVGRFWVPMHTRGNADHGVIAKDYRVKAPAA